MTFESYRDPLDMENQYCYRGEIDDTSATPWVYLGSVVTDDGRGPMLVSLPKIDIACMPPLVAYMGRDNVLTYHPVPNINLSPTPPSHYSAWETQTSPRESIEWFQRDGHTYEGDLPKEDPSCICPFPCEFCGTSTLGQICVVTAPEGDNHDCKPTENPSYVNGKAALHVEAYAQISHGEWTKLRFLVDTGAQFNLLKRHIVSHGSTKALSKPIELNGVNGGGLNCDREHTLKLQFSAVLDTGAYTVAETPTKFLIGDIPPEGLRGIDGILSFGWLARRRILIDTHEHGLVIPPCWDVSGLFRLEQHIPTGKGFKIPGLARGDYWGSPTPIQVEMKRRREAWDLSFIIPYPSHPAPGQTQQLLRPLLEVDEWGKVKEDNPVCPLPTCPFAPHKTQMKRMVDGLLIGVLPKLGLEALIRNEPEKWRTHCEKSVSVQNMVLHGMRKMDALWVFIILTPIMLIMVAKFHVGIHL